MQKRRTRGGREGEDRENDINKQKNKDKGENEKNERRKEKEKRKDQIRGKEVQRDMADACSTDMISKKDNMERGKRSRRKRGIYMSGSLDVTDIKMAMFAKLDRLELRMKSLNEGRPKMEAHHKCCSEMLDFEPIKMDEEEVVEDELLNATSSDITDKASKNPVYTNLAVIKSSWCCLFETI